MHGIKQRGRSIMHPNLNTGGGLSGAAERDDQLVSGRFGNALQGVG